MTQLPDCRCTLTQSSHTYIEGIGTHLVDIHINDFEIIKMIISLLNQMKKCIVFASCDSLNLSQLGSNYNNLSPSSEIHIAIDG